MFISWPEQDCSVWGALNCRGLSFFLGDADEVQKGYLDFFCLVILLCA